MADEKSTVQFARAIEDFRNARAKARLQHLWASVTGKADNLLQYDDITRKMYIEGQSSKGVQDIPVDAIVGSVNRYRDFDRNFLPLRDEDMERWARVKTAMTSPGSPGLPPIRVYQIGAAYFVLDGNHRVSIAKQMGISALEAHVTEIKTKVPISPEDTPEEIILKSEYSDFLKSTHVDEILPDVELELSFPGQYETLEEHIHVHRHYLGIEQEREITWEEAVQSWYTHVYLPVVEIIRDQNILSEFPGLTETDIYLWVLDRQTDMQEEFGWSIKPEKAAVDLVERKGRRFIRVLQRVITGVLRFILPKQLEDFSKTGEWLKGKNLESESMFEEILLAINGSLVSWVALEQGIILAEMEQSEIRCLIVEGEFKNVFLDFGDFEQAFYERLNQSNIKGHLVTAGGNINDTILSRAEVNDLLVLKLEHPPAEGFISRLKSGMRTIIRQSSRPLLLVREQLSPINHLLLAYDGSEKSEEALFIGKYFVEKYKKRLSLLVVSDNEEKGKELLAKAEEKLVGIPVNAMLHHTDKSISQVILQVAAEQYVDLILMGGYGFPPILEVFFGSTVDDVLRGTQIPVLICQ